MSAILESFSYRSLPALVGRRIRLFRIAPGRDAYPIHLTLYEAPLDVREPYYVALSYVWGDPEDTNVAICNKKILMITKPLHAALWQLRQDGRQCYFWADAVCINQRDLKEKTDQVRMMGDVYQQAHTVVVWLGKGEPDDREGYNLMVRLSRRLKGIDSSTVKPPYIEPLSSLNEPQHMDAMTNLLERPWFQRAWAVQEYCLARNRIFQSGHLMMAPEPFFEIADRLGKDFGLLASPSIAQSKASRNWHRTLTGGVFGYTDCCKRGGHLLRLLAQSQSLEMSDKRDRLFALVGLSSDADPDLIDYGRELRDVVVQVAKASIQTGLKGDAPWLALDSLCFVGPSDKGRINGVPSWAATYDLLDDSHSLISIFPLEKPLRKVPQVAFVIDDKTILILGRVFDSVNRIIDSDLNPWLATSPGLEVASECAKASKNLLAKESSMRKLAERVSPYPTDEDIGQVYWRSLICNSATHYEKVSARGEETFNAYKAGNAVSIVHLEHEAGEYAPESCEAVFCRLEWLAPDHDWRVQLQTVSGTLDWQFWEKLKMHGQELQNAMEPFAQSLAIFASSRRYFASKLGYLGWVPRSTQKGDRICAFYGWRFPCVIRPRAKTKDFELIGACYMHGIMEGEAIKLSNTQGKERNLVIALG